MTSLSKALRRYYRRTKNKVIFNNNQSLNQLALTMWEMLGYQQIDASVLSRVIKGERLFTGYQLNIFCKVLNLSKRDTEYLFSSLIQDITLREDLPIDNFLLPSSLGYDIVKMLIKDAFKTLHEGDTNELKNKCYTINTVIDLARTTQKDKWRPRIDELLTYNLYLQGRVIEGFALPKNIIKDTLPLSNKLFEIATLNKSKTAYAYGHILLSNAYYLAGGYSYAKNKYNFYKKSIILGKTALDNLEDFNNEKLFTLRVMAASAGYIKDYNTIMYIFTKTKDLLSLQPFENRVSYIHLCGTLSKGLAICKMTDPFSIRDSAMQHFHSDLSNTGIWELSSIKVEIDTLLALKTEENDYLKKKIKNGINIANSSGFIRHQKYFNNIISSL